MPGRRYTCYNCRGEFTMLASQRPGCLKAGCAFVASVFLLILGLFLLAAATSGLWSKEVKERRSRERMYRSRGGKVSREFCTLCLRHFYFWEPVSPSGYWEEVDPPCSYCGARTTNLSEEEKIRLLWSTNPDRARMTEQEVERAHSWRCDLCKPSEPATKFMHDAGKMTREEFERRYQEVFFP